MPVSGCWLVHTMKAVVTLIISAARISVLLRLGCGARVRHSLMDEGSPTTEPE